MVRVTRPGGVVYLSFTPWLSPWGGHETAPWHYLGRAPRPRAGTGGANGREPKNRFGESLFAVRAGRGAALGAACARTPTWWPPIPATTRGGPRWVIRVPGLRELVSWNLVVVLRRR